MNKKTITRTQKEDLHIDLTLHKFSFSILSQFTQKIVKPYYAGNLNKAITELISNTIREEQLFLNHTKEVERTNNG